MIGYKLFQMYRDGSIGSLFINRKQRYELNKQYVAEPHRTKGFAFRPGWHICSKPNAPHLSMKNRRWYVVEFSGDVQEHKRPENQGGLWYTSKHITILRQV